MVRRDRRASGAADLLALEGSDIAFALSAREGLPPLQPRIVPEARVFDTTGHPRTPAFYGLGASQEHASVPSPRSCGEKVRMRGSGIR